MMLGLYRFLTTLGAPVIHVYLGRRIKAGKEDPHRFNERLGRPALARPDGPLIWLHGASVGEAMSLLTLIARVKTAVPAANILVTTGTVTSARMLADRLPKGAVHQYVPVDRMAYVRRFLDHWRPDLTLWAESEFWPNLISETAVRGNPLVLVNGRISPRSFKGWSRAPKFIAGLLGGFALCLGQTEGDAERLRALGAPGARSVGNLKFAADPLPADAERLADMRAATAGRPLWLAASTWAGEEDIAWRVHQDHAAAHPGLLTLIVPRHPNRGPEIAAQLAAQGAKVKRRGAGDMPDARTEVYIADTMGELGLFFTLAPVVFMGKSLSAEGGQNLLEPARLGCAVLHGPRMTNFADMGARMAAAGASLPVADGAGLSAAVGRLLGDAGEAEAFAARARTFAQAEAGVIDRLMAELAPYLQRLDGAKGAV
ncbi:MAG TPA: 3-deoxy-D-manno-octulosonic acid transferase [Rhodospirillaceae bacterium]|nr:3-deoxy-D-manno-octulosonic acid transferase [Rhodospirillaceae bacterium]